MSRIGLLLSVVVLHDLAVLRLQGRTALEGNGMISLRVTENYVVLTLDCLSHYWIRETLEYDGWSVDNG